MEKKDVLTKILAIAGTALVWFPVLVLVLFFMVRLIRAHIFRFHYLLLAEFFPVVLIGGGLLLWAALRMHSHRGVIGWGLGIAAALLLIGMVIAVLTGLASGEMEATGFWWALVLATIIGYSLAVVVIGFGGLLLMNDLFKPSISTG